MNSPETMEIDLGDGRKAVIDASDFEAVRPYSWRWLKPVKHDNGTGYAQAAVRVDTGVYTTVLLHRLIGGAERGQVVSFKDSNGLNCTRENLLVGSRAESNQHSKVRRHSGTGMRNIREERGGYEVRIRKNGIRHKKWFRRLDEAIAWAAQKRLELHGQYAYSLANDARLMGEAA